MSKLAEGLGSQKGPWTWAKSQSPRLHIFLSMPPKNLHNSLYLLPFEVLQFNQLFNGSLKNVFVILFMIYNYSYSISILIVTEMK